MGSWISGILLNNMLRSNDRVRGFFRYGFFQTIPKECFIHSFRQSHKVGLWDFIICFIKSHDASWFLNFTIAWLSKIACVTFDVWRQSDVDHVKAWFKYHFHFQFRAVSFLMLSLVLINRLSVDSSGQGKWIALNVSSTKFMLQYMWTTGCSEGVHAQCMLTK